MDRNQIDKSSGFAEHTREQISLNPYNYIVSNENKIKANQNHISNSDSERITSFGLKNPKVFGSAYMDNMEQKDDVTPKSQIKLLHVSASPDMVGVDHHSQSPFNNAINKYVNAKGSKFTGKKKSKLQHMVIECRFQFKEI